MNAVPRRRPYMFGGPMFIGLVAAQRAAGHVRTVDFLLLFAGGVAFGVGLSELIGFIRTRRAEEQ
jgi:hypothetical protein